MSKLLANLSVRQRIVIAAVALAALAGVAGLVRWNRERDFRPLFTNLAPEDAAAIVTKLKETGTDYRLPEGGSAVLVPSARLAELRLGMAAAGLPKQGRIGFELFDKTNFGATDFTEHVNYRRALEGELERSVMSLSEVEQARVHLTFPKDSVFLESRQPAKASVLLKVKPGHKLAAQNVQAINHLVASAVEGLSPDAVSVLDMNGNLLGRPRVSLPDAPEISEAILDYRQQVESRLLAKVNATLAPLLGAAKFHAGVSVECDFTGGEQSEEVFDPARSVMLTSMRTEDGAATSGTAGVPGTASTLPRPASRPSSGSGGGVTRVTENITYQPTRTVKRTRLPGGSIKKMSLAILVDHELTWQREGNGYKRVLVAPSPEKLKIIKDLVAGVAGLDLQRGDQITVESAPFESTLRIEPPRDPVPTPPAAPATRFGWPPKLTSVQLMIGGATIGVVLLLAVVTVVILRKKKKRSRGVAASVPAAVPGGAPAPAALPPGMEGASVEQQIEAQIEKRNLLEQEAEARALSAIKAPAITKTAEVLAKHLRENIKKNPEIPAHVIRTWIREEEARVG